MAALSDRARGTNNTSAFRVLASFLQNPVWPGMIMKNRPMRDPGFGVSFGLLRHGKNGLPRRKR
jgi:hypothetical protein